jgi:hypothetical protein
VDPDSLARSYIDRLNLSPMSETYPGEALEEAAVNHWHDTMVDRPEPNGPAYLTGWTISGLAVIGTIVAVWILGI